MEVTEPQALPQELRPKGVLLGCINTNSGFIFRFPIFYKEAAYPAAQQLIANQNYTMDEGSPSM